MRRHAVAVACLAAALVIAATATADHRWKDVRASRAEVPEWYCEHYGTGCGGSSSAGIEAHWNVREWGYAIAFAVLAGYGVVRLAGDVIVDRRRMRLDRDAGR